MHKSAGNKAEKHQSCGKSFQFEIPAWKYLCNLNNISVIYSWDGFQLSYPRQLRFFRFFTEPEGHKKHL